MSYEKLITTRKIKRLYTRKTSTTNCYGTNNIIKKKKEVYLYFQMKSGNVFATVLQVPVDDIGKRIFWKILLKCQFIYI